MAESVGPGPTYALPPTIGYEKHHLGKHRGPQYSIGARLNPIEKNLTPGPALNLENKTRYGNKPTYAYSIASRLDKKSVKSVGPGPAGYAVNAKRCVDSSCPPAYSIAARDKFQFKQSSPGPMAYSIKDNVVMPTSPAYSIAQRTSLKSKGGSPGPANYALGSPNKVLNAPPQYSMAARRSYGPKSVGPGSAYYDRSYYRPGKTSQAFSFGIRHTPKSPPMVVACDNI